MINDCVGKIKISKELLESFWFNNKYFVPVSAVEKEEYFEYTCYCNKFRKLIDGERIPEYNISYIKTITGPELYSVEELK